MRDTEVYFHTGMCYIGEAALVVSPRHIVTRVKSGNFGHQVNSDSDLASFIS